MKKLCLLCIALIAAAMCLHAPQARAKSDKLHRSADAIPNRYIVVVEDQPGDGRGTAALTDELMRDFPGTLHRRFSSALPGYSVQMSPDMAERLSLDPRVKYVEEDALVTTTATQYNAPWGLDRIDQRSGPYDANYIYDRTGAGVHVYIIDTGIRTTHTDFGGRASHAFDSVGDGQNGNDCHGHGTHVAGTVGGREYGVAKGVWLHAVRVLGCDGSGLTSGVIAGIDWVTQNHGSPAVANMSLGGSYSLAMNTAVANSVASGVTYVVAAGNEGSDACTRSPSSAQSAITTGAATSLDERAFFSNWGTCVDIFAPGNQVISAWSSSDTATNMISGTSMASPHAAGVAAVFLEGDPAASPAAVVQALTSVATAGVLANVGTGSPNLLLYSNLTPAETPCNGTSYNGNIATSGGSDYQSSSNGFAGRSGVYSGTLNVPTGSQFRLTLELKKGSRWGVVAATSGTGGTESITHRGKTGTYRWRIESLSAGGAYGLCSVTP